MTPAAARVIVGLAIEGVPVRAIARATCRPAEDVIELLEVARENGEIVVLPRSDWPPGTPRDNRIQTAVAVRLEDLEAFRVPLQRTFDLTPMQARFLAVLVCRREASRETMHRMIGSTGEVSTVKAVAHYVRRSLARHGFAFEHIREHGWAMSRATAEQILLSVKRARAEARS